MDETLIESLVAKIAMEMQAGQPSQVSQPKMAKKQEGFSVADYPILEKHPEVVRSQTGKGIADITLESVADGQVSSEDIRISRQMLLNQAQVAEDAGKVQLAENLRRASELTEVPDDTVIRMYDMLRPNRATKQQLAEMARTLREIYQAPLCAGLVEEAAQVYERRGILLKEDG